MLSLRGLRSLRAIGVSRTKVSATAIEEFEKYLGHALEAIPPSEEVQITAPEEKVTASGVHYFDYGTPPGPVIEGAIPRGKVRMDTQWTLYTLDGRPVKVSEQKGKVLFFNFWATSCGSCLDEIPTIEDLSIAMKDSGVFFACVSQEEPAQIQAFLKRHPTKAPIYMIKDLPASSVFTREFPCTYIVAPAGDVVVRFAGSRNWNTQEIMNYFLRLKAEKEKKPSHP
jgi:thiol-disulfide isomerase/thioredoxin